MNQVKVSFLVCLLAVLSAAGFSTPSYITDGTMTWNRGDAGSTWQEWEFMDSTNPSAPEASNNPYGSPDIQLTGLDGSVPFLWKDGVWMGDPIFALITIPNNPVLNPYKIVFFEMKYKMVDMLAPVLTAGANYTIDPFYSSDIQPDLSQDWHIMTLGWMIRPNPAVEFIDFALAGTGGFVDYVYVDTICVPEPATLAILGIGLFAMIKRK